MTALGTEDIESQNRIAEQAGIPPLVRLLRSHPDKTSDRVLLAVIKALGTLCIGENLIYNISVVLHILHVFVCICVSVCVCAFNYESLCVKVQQDIIQVV